MEYIVIAVTKKDQKFVGPMAYGREDQPAPELLLIRDCATVFLSHEQALSAVMETLRIAKANNESWHKKYYFVQIKIEEDLCD